MSERHFRIILGLWLIIGLFLNLVMMIYALLGLLLFEGVTNLRIPNIVSKMRYGEIHPADVPSEEYRFSFEAERALRFFVVLFVALPFIPDLEFLWWMQWFVGFALIGAGLSGICPMVLALRYTGLR